MNALKIESRHVVAYNMGKALFQTFVAVGFCSTKHCLAAFVLLSWISTPQARAEVPARATYSPLDTWHDDVVYSLFVDRFHQSGKGSASTPIQRDLKQFQGGNLLGLIEKLDYLRELGITVLLLNPIVRGASYHGYHPLDHFSISPELGSLADFDRLVQEAHRRGLKVLFDFVSNHVAPDCPLVKQHPAWFRDPAKDGVFRFEPPMTFTERHRATYFGLPDFDQSQQEVYEFLLRFAKFWIDRGVDGFRMDAVNLIAPEYWHRLTHDIKSYAGRDFFILGEVYDLNVNILKMYAPYFDAIFDFITAYSAKTAFIQGLPASKLRAVYQARRLYSSASMMLSPFIDNHDNPRFITAAREYYSGSTAESRARNRYHQALLFLMTQPGMPTLLYGSEIGLDDAPTLRESIYDRSRNVMRFEGNEADETYVLLKNLISLRKKNRWGRAIRLEIGSDDRALLYLLRNPDTAQQFVVLHNLNSELANSVPVVLQASVFTATGGYLKDLFSGEHYNVVNGQFSITLKSDQSRILLFVPGG